MQNSDLLRLQETNLRNLLKAGAFQFIDDATPWFPYTSGQVGPYYVQSIAIEKDGAAYAEAIRSLVEMIRSEFTAFDAISGGETRDWDFSNPVAVALKMPHIKIYKDGKILGAEISGKKILHVADLNNEGSSVRDYWKPLIEKHGGQLVGFVAFVDRREEGFSVLRGLGLEPLSVVPLDERAWDIALAEKYVPQHVRDTLVERMADPAAWARRELLANPGRFRQFHADPNTRGKALKIIKTYPEIAEKLRQIAD